MDLPQLLDLARTGGPAGAVIFALLWWLERAERREKERLFRDAIGKMTASTGDLITAFKLLRAQLR